MNIHHRRTILLAVHAVISCSLSAFSDPPKTGSGTNTFWESLAIGEPISANSGSYYFSLPLLSLGGPLSLSFRLDYRMDNYTVGMSALDSNFRDNLNMVLERMIRDGGTEPVAEVDIKNGTVLQFVFDAVSNCWNSGSASPIGYVLKETGATADTGYYYLMDPMAERVHIFEKVAAECYSDWCPARLLYTLDRNGNQLEYLYTDNRLHPDRIQDGLGRRLDFAYDEWGMHVTNVTDQAGRSIRFIYEDLAPDFGSNTVLRSVVDSSGHSNTFFYTYLPTKPATAPIVAERHPLGNTPYTQMVADITLNGESWARVTAQSDAYGHTATIDYDVASNRVTMTRANGTTVVYEHAHNNGPLRRITDPEGLSLVFSATSNEQMAAMTDRLGETAQATYHEISGKLETYEDLSGRVLTFAYAAQTQVFTNPVNAEEVEFTFYDLASATHPDEAVDRYGRDACGNLTVYSNRAGEAWTYTYNGRGQLLTVSNPAGGVATATYYPDGTLASQTDSDPGSGTNVYAYDGCKRLASITAADGHAVSFAYDVCDRLTGMVDELERTNTLVYDANGNLDAAINPLGESTAYAQDLMDRETAATDPLGHVWRRFYDSMERLSATADANGNTNVYHYNTRNELTGITDPSNQTWTMQRDSEGVITSTVTPLGFRTEYEIGAGCACSGGGAGQLLRRTDPLGNSSGFGYDAAGRLAAVTDRLGRVTAFAYDAAGRLIGVADASCRTGTYTRNSLGQLTRLRDPTGGDWEFGHSPMGRLTSTADPFGRTTSYAYDPRGRLEQIDYPAGGGSAVFAYDAAGQATQKVYPGGPVLSFAYDGAGRLAAAEHLALQYDARGAVTNAADGTANYGAEYDAGGRLAAVSYDGQATVTYTYDQRDLLIRVEDDLSGAWMEFVYDADRRLERIERSNGIVTTNTYDDAGRIVRIQDGALGDQQYTLNAEGDSVEAVRTLPLDDFLGSAVQSVTYDAAAQVSSAGYTYDARGRQTTAPDLAVTYDGASRLTAITSGAESVALEYNGLGDVRSRTAGGITTRFYNHYAIHLFPVVAEKRDDVYRRFYVFTPQGQLLYGIDVATAKPVFYHFDAVGSTLFLTDESGAVSDAYAYDPYGNLLGRTGTNDQPFTYIGRFGVRREPVGGLYDMRARFYDPSTARFLTRDPLWPNLTDLAALNPYQYAAQNPLRYIDPEGTDHWVGSGHTFRVDDTKSGNFDVNKWVDEIERLDGKKHYSESYSEYYDEESGAYVFNSGGIDFIYVKIFVPEEKAQIDAEIQRRAKAKEERARKYAQEEEKRQQQFVEEGKRAQEEQKQKELRQQRIRTGYRKMMWTICRLNGPTVRAMAADAGRSGMSVEAFCWAMDSDEEGNDAERFVKAWAALAWHHAEQ